MAKKYQSNSDTDILVAKDTGERSDLAWHHNLQNLTLGASCGLEVSEGVLTQCRNAKVTEDVMTLGSLNDVYNSGVSMESVMMES